MTENHELLYEFLHLTQGMDHSTEHAAQWEWQYFIQHCAGGDAANAKLLFDNLMAHASPQQQATVYYADGRMLLMQTKDEAKNGHFTLFKDQPGLPHISQTFVTGIHQLYHSKAALSTYFKRWDEWEWDDVLAATIAAAISNYSKSLDTVSLAHAANNPQDRAKHIVEFSNSFNQIYFALAEGDEQSLIAIRERSEQSIPADPGNLVKIESYTKKHLPWQSRNSDGMPMTDEDKKGKVIPFGK